MSSALLTVSAFGSILAALACVLALVLRFRRARGEERQQLRWLAYAAGLCGFFLILLFASSLFGVGEGGEDNVVANSAFFLLVSAWGLGSPWPRVSPS